ncbi:hypothetical protein [Paenibacillus ginsengarvi]|uniref:Uncharacterized protein n=1 Tax=Paenibacillus ginsengarvi TaxID=400777 RepID=A0A3B0CMZ6_9BACL|nr:hypothetical protein [Paenibacillus ginsengarvi]RKN86552.1 hypothetical protein D7M11_00865 [Paenibacillus ginsengarvi]
MMMCKLAKSVMENEEGLNHLLIKWGERSGDGLVRVRIRLPEGIYRKPNLSGYPETNSGDIVVAYGSKARQIVVELYTSEPIDAGMKTVVIEAAFESEDGLLNWRQHAVSFEARLEDKMEDAEVDPEVAEVVKRLQPCQASDPDYRFEKLTPLKPIRIAPLQLSDLEKKYRIDYSCENGGVRWI